MALQKLVNKVHENNVEQKTIDLVEDAYRDFYASNDYTETDLGAYIYEVGICLEIYNPCLRVDIETLKGLEQVLENRLKQMKKQPKKELA